MTYRIKIRFLKKQISIYSHQLDHLQALAINSNSKTIKEKIKITSEKLRDYQSDLRLTIKEQAAYDDED